ncbi:hypothetical protein DM02DRAFT_652094 [Periconia macrospinosa]|uniref:Uncharacterized protein n=1 Tax=Periconia macrospinosa TaxID=97972 RepID=A0A2V1E3Q6_9PLEO|nr:hypothetical protein DM02DRAFT_652094 [Periconia macrospinosa]
MPFFNNPSGTNVVDYSHSTVFTTTYATPPPTLSVAVPPLTTIYTAPSSCSNRWMMNATQTVNDAPVSIAFSRILPNALYDPEYLTCQPFAVAPTYSPGVCPDGHTIAEVTEHQVSKTAGGMDRYWQASCCKSGLRFGAATKGLCYSSVTAPLAVHGLVTGRDKASGMTVTAYEFNNDGSTVRRMEIMTRGLAIADPVIVGWQIQDLEAFPSTYASSLAKMIGVSAQETPAPGSASTAPLSTGQSGGQGTSSPSSSPSSSPPVAANSSLSPAVKAGIAVGVIANIAILGAIVAFFIMKRSKKKSASPPSDTDEILEVPRRGELGGGGKSELHLSGKTWSEQISPITMTRQELAADRETHELGPGKELHRKGSEILSGAPIELDASTPDYISRAEKSSMAKAENQVF